MTAIPAFEDVFTEEWLSDVLMDGQWDPDHGSDVGRLIEDIQAGTPGLPPCPDGYEHSDYDWCAGSEAFRDTIMVWAKSRYDDIVAKIGTDPEFTLGRRMTVDDDWHGKLATGDATLGFYYGQLPFDHGGSFWIDEDKPVDIYMEVRAKSEDIDWEGSLKARIDYCTGDDEAEIRLKEDVSVVLEKLLVDDVADKNLVGRSFNTGKRVYVFLDMETTSWDGPTETVAVGFGKI